MLLRALLAAIVLGVGAPLAAQQPATPPPTPAVKKPAKTAKTAKTAKPAPPPPAKPLAAADTIQATAPTSSSTLVTAVVPAPDQARGVDAEVRAALFDLVSDRPLTALSRLEWLALSPTPVGQDPTADRHTREDLLFLLAESYFRLGLSSAFQTVAQQLLILAPTGRYVAVVQMQLMLDAYRRGDLASARAQAAKATGTPDASLAEFVVGLAAYRAGDFPAARASDAAVIAGGNPAYVPYARYMDALATAQGDPSRAGTALDSLQPLVANATGPFADQVRLAAAQLAYQAAQYPVAAQFAAQVSANGGLGPDAMLARAWSLYRAGQFDSSAALFGEYAVRWPQLPGRDEARLMHGQILLEQHHAASAEPYFAQAADSLTTEIAAMRGHLNAAAAQAASALVAARAAGAIYVRDAETGKALMLAPDAGAEGSVVMAAFNASPPPALADTTPPTMLTVGDVQARFAAIAPTLSPDVPQRVFYTAASSPRAYADYLVSDQALLAADLAAAVAQFRLRMALGDRAMRVAALKNLQLLVVEGSANLNEQSRQIATTSDSQDVMSRRLVAARQMLRDAMDRQTSNTRASATHNLHTLDSLRASLSTIADATDREVLATEIQTAGIYRELAEKIRRGADSAIKLHPVFGLRDSIAVRLVRARSSSTQGQQLLVANATLVTVDLARMEATESDPTRAARRALTVAEQQRQEAEQRMVSLVNEELRARAAQMVEALERSREAADYGSASAAFFVAVEAKATESAAAPAAAPAPER